MKYEVESGIEMPPPPKRGRTAKYPFREMAVGDSFEIRVDKIADTQNASRVFAHRNRWKLSCRQMLDGTWRCFRLA